MKPFKKFLNESKLDDLRNALNKTPEEKFDIIVNTEGMERVVYKLGLKGITGEESTEEQRIKLFREVDNKLYYPRLPVSYFFDKPIELPEGTKLVHFTNYADDIVKNGFTKGTKELNRLGMSWGSMQTTSKEGWNYAFPEDYIEQTYGTMEKAMKHWNAKEVVRFEADAILAFHYGDDVYQALFWGPSAKNIERIK